jgi:hypothetical protein
MKKYLFILLIIFLFLLGPWAFMNVLGVGVSLKYEVDHPRAMGLEENGDLTDLESGLNKKLYLFWALTIIGPISAIGLLICKNKRSNI